MDNNDFLGSFAQENVTFQTQIIKTAAVGDNYWKVMVFIENSRYVADQTAFIAVQGSTTIKAATVTADDYATVTQGLLQSWLTDLFANGFTGDVYLVQCAGDIGTGDPASTVADFKTAMETAYELLKPYAYWKAVLAGTPEVASGETTSQASEIAAALADLCVVDKQLLSGPVPVPYSTKTPETLTSDPYYVSCKDKYVFMAAHQDATRNAALYSLGLALSIYNGSGTPIGNSLDMVRSSSITSSGADGAGLSKTVRQMLNGVNIQTFKPVGNNTGDVAAEGDKALNGDVIGAQWILCYVAYMVKVRVAEMLTTVNFYKNEANYTRILDTLTAYINLFGPSGSGRLEGISLTAPSYNSLPEADSDELVIPNAWEATYVNHLRKVTITGTLYIGV